MPEPEVLMARLRDLQKVRTRTKASVNNIETLLGQTTTQLKLMVDTDDATLRARVIALSSRLQQSLKRRRRLRIARQSYSAKDAMPRFVTDSARLIASGLEFFLEAKDPLLDATIKAGLHLDYGYSSSNSGYCKVRALTGQVRKIRDHDYVLSCAFRPWRTLVPVMADTIGA